MENAHEPKPGALRSKLMDHEEPISDQAWVGIEKRLRKKKRRIFFFWWVSCLMLIGTGTALWMLKPPSLLSNAQKPIGQHGNHESVVSAEQGSEKSIPTEKRSNPMPGSHAAAPESNPEKDPPGPKTAAPEGRILPEHPAPPPTLAAIAQSGNASGSGQALIKRFRRPKKKVHYQMNAPVGNESDLEETKDNSTTEAMSPELIASKPVTGRSPSEFADEKSQGLPLAHEAGHPAFDRDNSGKNQLQKFDATPLQTRQVVFALPGVSDTLTALKTRPVDTTHFPLSCPTTKTTARKIWKEIGVFGGSLSQQIQLQGSIPQNYKADNRNETASFSAGTVSIPLVAIVQAGLRIPLLPTVQVGGGIRSTWIRQQARVQLSSGVNSGTRFFFNADSTEISAQALVSDRTEKITQWEAIQDLVLDVSWSPERIPIQFRVIWVPVRMRNRLGQGAFDPEWDFRNATGIPDFRLGIPLKNGLSLGFQLQFRSGVRQLLPISVAHQTRQVLFGAGLTKTW